MPPKKQCRLTYLKRLVQSSCSKWVGQKARVRAQRHVANLEINIRKVLREDFVEAKNTLLAEFPNEDLDVLLDGDESDDSGIDD